jgi:hypothetical protein
LFLRWVRLLIKFVDEVVDLRDVNLARVAFVEDFEN